MRSSLVVGGLLGLLILGTQFSSTIKAQQENPVIPKAGPWEYKIVTVGSIAVGIDPFDSEGTAARLEKSLNTFAAEGWELDQLDRGFIFLKRARQK